MGLYEVPLSMALLGFEMGTMLANFHICCNMLLLRAVLNMLVRNASLRVSMCFRCLMFSLFYCLLDLSCGECNVISLYFLCCPVNGSDLFVLCVACLTVFENCLVKQFAIVFRVVVVLLLNDMEVFSVCGVLLDRPCMVFQRMCVLCL